MTQFEMTIYIILICLALGVLTYYSIKRIIKADKETWKKLKERDVKNWTPKQQHWFSKQKDKYLKYLDKLIEKDNEEEKN